MGHTGDVRYASDLVEFIRREHDGCFHIEVGCYPECHPQSDDAHVDLRHFKRKVDAGANGAITQYFYNADAYFRFVDDARALGIDIPIVPGLMPISNFTQLRRFSETCGAEIPRWIGKRMQAYGDDANGVRESGADRSEEHTSELQSLMRISYAVFCLKNKKTKIQRNCHESYQS